MLLAMQTKNIIVIKLAKNHLGLELKLPIFSASLIKTIFDENFLTKTKKSGISQIFSFLANNRETLRSARY